ncbi:MAG TPA: cytidine deaminase [Atribacteraceae bacterium]|nr:cytidine deaminase [Atribacteraceae bacterium]
MVTIFLNRTGKERFIGHGRLKKLVEFVFSHEERSIEGKLEITLVQCDEIRKLKHEFFGIDRDTDVIAFPYGDSEPDSIWGELVLCPSYIREEALEKGIALEEEYLRVTIHGLLHLLDYNDQSLPSRKQMEERQEFLLRAFQEREVREKLMTMATEARHQAYVPASGFRVGAALEAQGAIFSGCNVENASLALTVCAERVALFKAVSEGYRVFRRLAVVSDETDLCFPCGACRQVLFEFSPDLELLCGNSLGHYQVHGLAELFPFPFRLRERSPGSREET